MRIVPSVVGLRCANLTYNCEAKAESLPFIDPAQGGSARKVKKSDHPKMLK
jgi:hypothetical protein